MALAKKGASGKKAWKAKAKARKAEALDLGKRVTKLARRLKRAGGEVADAGARVSPLAPAAFPDLPVIAGVAFATSEAAIKAPGRPDVMLVRLDPGTTIAGVFTRSATRAAPVLDCEAKLRGRVARDAGAAIVVNSGNANAFTGAEGVAGVARIADAVAEALGIPVARVYTASTGVIGQALPDDRIRNVIGDLANGLDPAGIADAARAIMTTDTFPKGASAEVEGEGGTIRIAGIAKGSGMIAPDLGTMLSYIFTDASIAAPALQKMLSRQTGASFNAITVDGDTSTSDTVMLAATGKGSAAPITDLRARTARAFEAALGRVMQDLAHQIVRDGEGATKFVEVRVTGAADAADARRVAMSVANSPLVKTAVAGADPNWGRIVMAVGKSGARADRDRLAIRFGDVLVAANGQVAPEYREVDGVAEMRRDTVVIGVDLGLAKGAATVWTCDLTARYIEINADYRS